MYPFTNLDFDCGSDAVAENHLFTTFDKGWRRQLLSIYLKFIGHLLTTIYDDCLVLKFT